MLSSSKHKIIMFPQKWKTLDNSVSPFCSPNSNFHSDIPGQRADRPYITMQPLLQIAIIDVLIHKQPERTVFFSKLIQETRESLVKRFSWTKRTMNPICKQKSTFEHLQHNTQLNRQGSYVLLFQSLLLQPWTPSLPDPYKQKDPSLNHYTIVLFLISNC